MTIFFCNLEVIVCFGVTFLFLDFKSTIFLIIFFFWNLSNIPLALVKSVAYEKDFYIPLVKDRRSRNVSQKSDLYH